MNQIALGSLDPYRPILSGAMGSAGHLCNARMNQRTRRSEILAAVRQLLAEQGCQQLTMRAVAKHSGCAIQTVYNLVGPRNEAIIEAIAEYNALVSRSGFVPPGDLLALPDLVSRTVDVVAIRPQFAQQCGLIFFTPARSIYYTARLKQSRILRTLLGHQQKAGIIRKSTDIRLLADMLMLFLASKWMDWADRPRSLDALHADLNAGFRILLEDKLEPPHREAILRRFGAPL